MRCATPEPPTAQRTKDRARLSAFREANDSLLKEAPTEVPILFHVIRDDDGSGDLTDAILDEQVRVLNAASEKHQIHFTRAGVERTKNKRWYRMGYHSAAEREAKAKLGKTPEKRLNFYTASIGGGLLGWATFPFDLASSPQMDGVVILNTSLPGGAAKPYDQGKTGVHEVGHWLGLYHTFQGGCEAPSDEVYDTPGEASPAKGPCSANQNRNSCPEPGADDFTNFMDYVDDSCMDHFTTGQAQRMQMQVGIYRPELLLPSARRALKSVSVE